MQSVAPAEADRPSLTAAVRYPLPAARVGRYGLAWLWVAVGGVALAFGLRLWLLGGPSLWYDEGVSWSMAREPLGAMLAHLARSDFNPPLYVLLLRPWLPPAGQREFALRFPSALAGTLVVPLCWVLARRAFGSRPAAAASALLAASSVFLIDFSQEARGYSLAAALSVLSAYALLRLTDRSPSPRRSLRHPPPLSQGERGAGAADEGIRRWGDEERGASPAGGRQPGISPGLAPPASPPGPLIPSSPHRLIPSRWWFAYALATVAAVYTHYACALLLPAHLLVAVARRRRLGAVVGAWALSATLYLPWLPSLARQVAAMRAAPDFWGGHVAPTLAPERVLAAIMGGPGALPGQTGLVFALGLAVLAPAAALAVAARPGERAAALFPALLVIFPLAEAALLTTWAPKFIDRYLLPMAPAAYVAAAGLLAPLGGNRRLRFPAGAPGADAALGLAPIDPRHGRLRRAVSGPGFRAGIGAVAVLAVAASGVQAARHAPAGAVQIKDGDTRAAVAFIEAHAEPGDAVVLAQDTGPVFAYYYHGALGGEGSGWFRLAPEFSRGDDLPALAAALNTAARGHRRLWALLWHEDFADPTGYLRNALALSGTEVLEDHDALNYDLRLYALRPGAQFSAAATPLHPMVVRLGPHVTFLGDGLEQWDRPADAPFVFHTWFRTDAPLDRDYQAVLRLERDGEVWSQVAMRPSVYTYPATHWLPGIDVPGRLPFTVGPQVPPGDYHVTLALYDPVAGRDLPAVDPRRGDLGSRVDLGAVRVLAPGRPARPAPALALDRPVDAGFRLLGADPLPAHLPPGGSASATLFWQANGRPEADYRVQLELLSEAAPATPLPVAPAAPPAPGLGTAEWPAGSSFEDIRALQLPARMPAGAATLQARLLPAGGGPAVVLPIGRLMVDPRPRRMTPPATLGRPFQALFGGAALLAGVQVDEGAARPGGQAVVTLTWQCRAPLDADYTVFVHLLDAGNGIGGRQHDGPPNGGEDPTTSWLPGQWIVDRHVVPIPAGTPPGSYRLEVGLYRRAGDAFKRLPLAGGGDAAMAGEVTVR